MLFHRTSINISTPKWELGKKISIAAFLANVQMCTVSFVLTSARRQREFVPRLRFTGNLITITLV